MRSLAALVFLVLAACQQTGGTQAPGDQSDHQPYSGIAADETLHFTGTEPFWGGRVRGTQLTYSTPDNQDGTTFTVERFGGRGGLALSGELNGDGFDMTVTPGECSDGMSDRTYPFTVTLSIADSTHYGCAWTDAKKYEGPESP